MPALATSNVTVAYRGLVALSEVSLELERGTITGLIGPNGAGKSTMIGVLSGLVRPRGGHVLLDGRDITRLPPHRRARLGMARTFQRLELWRSMSVAENVRTAADFASSWQRGWDARSAARDAIELLGLREVEDREITELSSGQGRLVEVARAVALRPKVLLLDEPSAGMNPSETETPTKLIGLLRRELSLAILLIEHHMEVVMGISDRITVLDYGTRIAEGTSKEIQRHPRVIEAYLGSGYEQDVTVSDR
jgi:ABC-type branched-subunit amino acid transport system ATPase component